MFELRGYQVPIYFHLKENISKNQVTNLAITIGYGSLYLTFKLIEELFDNVAIFYDSCMDGYYLKKQFKELGSKKNIKIYANQEVINLDEYDIVVFYKIKINKIDTNKKQLFVHQDCSNIDDFSNIIKIDAGDKQICYSIW